MRSAVFLYHYNELQPLWHQPGIYQCGPRVVDGPQSINTSICSVSCLVSRLISRGINQKGVILHYTDPFILRSSPLTELANWPGPKILACGDLHHGPQPIKTVVDYVCSQFHDAVILTFNPSHVSELQSHINIPVHSYPPSFFRYPVRSRKSQLSQKLVHIGSIGPFHTVRRQVVNELIMRARVPFQHLTTTTPEQAADIYSSNAIALNIPLNCDLNHRFFEIMAAGSPQIVYGNPGLFGATNIIADRADVLWANSIGEIEQLANKLLSDPATYTSRVSPPPQYSIDALCKLALKPPTIYLGTSIS